MTSILMTVTTNTTLMLLMVMAPIPSLTDQSRLGLPLHGRSDWLSGSAHSALHVLGSTEWAGNGSGSYRWHHHRADSMADRGVYSAVRTLQIHRQHR